MLAGIGAFLAGFEHLDGWGGADRGFFGGAIYGTALLVTHQLVGTRVLAPRRRRLAELLTVSALHLVPGGTHDVTREYPDAVARLIVAHLG